MSGRQVIFTDIRAVLGPSDRPPRYATGESWWHVLTESGRELHVPTRRVPRHLRWTPAMVRAEYARYLDSNQGESDD